MSSAIHARVLTTGFPRLWLARFVVHGGTEDGHEVCYPSRLPDWRSMPRLNAL